MEVSFTALDPKDKKLFSCVRQAARRVHLSHLHVQHRTGGSLPTPPSALRARLHSSDDDVGRGGEGGGEFAAVTSNSLLMQVFHSFVAACCDCLCCAVRALLCMAGALHPVRRQIHHQRPAAWHHAVPRLRRQTEGTVSSASCHGDNATTMCHHHVPVPVPLFALVRLAASNSADVPNSNAIAIAGASSSPTDAVLGRAGRAGGGNPYHHRGRVQAGQADVAGWRRAATAGARPPAAEQRGEGRRCDDPPPLYPVCLIL